MYGEISDNGYIGVEFLYPSNVETFYVKGEKETLREIIKDYTLPYHLIVLPKVRESYNFQ